MLPLHGNQMSIAQKLERLVSDWDDDGNIYRSQFLKLPPELHLRIMSYLDFREIQFLRATNSYFYKFLSTTDLARFRADYIEILYQEELDGVANSIKDDGFTSIYEEVDMDRKTKKRHFNYLTCFSCFRLRHYSHFAVSQCTQRRRKGHIHARKRFCEDCGVTKGIWQLGTELQFPSDLTRRVYCAKCKMMRFAPSVHAYLRRVHQGLCGECLSELEVDYTQDEIYEITADLAKEKKRMQDLTGMY